VGKGVDIAICMGLDAAVAVALFLALTAAASHLATSGIGPAPARRRLRVAFAVSAAVAIGVGIFQGVVMVSLIGHSLRDTSLVDVLLPVAAGVIPLEGVMIAIRPAQMRLRQSRGPMVSGRGQVALLLQMLALVAVIIGVPWMLGGYGTTRVLLVIGTTAAAVVVLQVVAGPLVVYALGTTPLPPDVRARFMSLAERTGTKVRDFRTYAVAGPKGSNALQVGIVPSMRYVLVSENLPSDLSPPELDAVVTHELGHAKENHVLIKALSLAVLFGSIQGALRARVWTRSELLLIPFIPLLAVIATIAVIGILGIYLEERADSFAAGLVGGPELAAALERLSRIRGRKVRSGTLASILTQHPGFTGRVARLRAGPVPPRPRLSPGPLAVAAVVLVPLAAFVVNSAAQWHPDPGAVREAQEIGLQPTDFTSGPVHLETASSGWSRQERNPAGTCHPLSGRPWLADVSSPRYSNGIDFFGYSEVMVFPTPGYAAAGIREWAATSFRRDCLSTGYASNLLFAVETAGCKTTPHVATFDLRPFHDSVLPGAVGWVSTATVRCTFERFSVNYTEIARQVGDLWISMELYGTTADAYGSFVRAFDSMTARAARHH
jgi:Zn-dependent protease with chaperone function